MLNKDLKRRILEISYKKGLSHLGSCLTAVDIIAEIFKVKKLDERFILSSGHAGLALYVVLEKYLGLDAEKIFKHHGVHPDRCKECHIDYSAGSLGQGLSAATGMALANRNRNVYTLVSDGELQEGSCYEALEVAHQRKLTNLKVFVNCNGWGAYQALDREHIIDRCRAFTNINITFRQTNVDDFPFLKGQQGHYLVLDEKQYEMATKQLGSIHDRG